MIILQNGAHRAANHESNHGQFFHQREDLVGQLSQPVKEMTVRGLEADWDIYQSVKKVHRSILVDPQDADPL